MTTENDPKDTVPFTEAELRTLNVRVYRKDEEPITVKQLEYLKQVEEIRAVIALRRKHTIEGFTIPAATLAAVILAIIGVVSYEEKISDSVDSPSTVENVNSLEDSPVPDSNGVVIDQEGNILESDNE